LEQPAGFEITEALTGYPELSNFILYRPLSANGALDSTSKEFFAVDAAGSDTLIAVEEGDRLFVGENNPDTGPVLGRPAIMVVDKVRELGGKKVFTIKGALQNSYNSLTGFKLGRSFNHFGHNAPPEKVELPDTIDEPAVSVPIEYERNLTAPTTKWIEPDLAANQVPLDREVDDISPGTVFIWQWSSGSAEYAVFVPVTKVLKGSYAWGVLNGGVTLLEMSPPGQWPSTVPVSLDIRSVRYHETTGPRLNIHALPAPVSGETGRELYFIGTDQAAAALKKRVIVIKPANGAAGEYTVDSVEECPSAFGQYMGASRLYLNKDVTFADFPYEGNQAMVFGNVAVGATQGKTEKEAVLGNGDSREAFQTFKLPKKPLTFLKDTGSTPPEVPELEVYVNQRKWTWVDSLFGKGPKDEVYIVRLDEEGESWVQFGDGKTGARLPSGLKNITVRYRTGTGAYGKIKEGTYGNAGANLDRLARIHMPGEAFDGAQAESGENARQTAPGKVQNLGRLVSLKDYEYEAMGIGGVVKAEAAWGLSPAGGTPSLLLTVLMEHGYGNESYKELEKTLNDYNRERGPERFPVVVLPGSYKNITVGLMIGYDTRFKPEILEGEIHGALGVYGGGQPAVPGCSAGLLSAVNRGFGRPEYRTRIQGVVQRIPGIAWVRVTSLDTVVCGGEPENTVPTAEVSALQEKITCGKTEVIVAYEKHLFISFHGDRLGERE
jgi:peptidoglycan hydrolase-like protein with peptidoglycan-binding domain